MLTFTDTSATKLRALGSFKGGSGPEGGTPCTIRPSVTPSRRRMVKALVSMSHSPGTPRADSHAPSERLARQWHARVLTSPTISPAAQIRLDSNHLEL